MDGSFQIVKEPARRSEQQKIGVKALFLTYEDEGQRPEQKGSDPNFPSVVPVLVELTGIEPVTPCLQSRCSPS